MARARRREDRFTGVLDVDKPTGMTSHDVVAHVRRASGQRRVGHAGTLDPMATGVLLVCLGRATRIAEYLADLPKVYRAGIHFGLSTDTWDADGTVTEERDASHLTREYVEGLLGRFTGRLMQVPPMYSALKRDGEPLYRLARRGETVVREARPVEITRLEVVAWEPPRLTLDVHCSRGTYVRALARDLGRAAGTGAHLDALRRLAIGDLRAEEGVALDALTDAEAVARHLIPPVRALGHLYGVVVGADEARRLAHGQAIPLDAAPATERVVAQDAEGHLVAILRPGDEPGHWRPEKVLAAPARAGDTGSPS